MKYRGILDEFMSKLDARMRDGYEEYGDESFDRPLLTLIKEIEEELLDICGWGMITYSRIQDIKEKIATMVEELRHVNG